MTSYTQLTQAERYQIEALHEAGRTENEIATQLKRSQSTINRELRRNGQKQRYDAVVAQQRCSRRHKTKPKRCKSWVEHAPRIVPLLEHKFSPERIAAHFKKMGAETVSHEWIYLHLREDARKGGMLWRYLPRGRRRRTPRRIPGENKRGQIVGRVSIDKRPPEASNKSRMGDWEIDTVVSAGKQTAVVTALERKSRLYLTAFVPDRRARTVSDALITLLAPYQQQQMVKTITADNGREFSEHIRIAQHLDCAFYFADPYASWQRGSNEHHNGLLRRFFPKGTDFACVPETALQTATTLINLWPRKNLNGLCPLDMIPVPS
ncbi:IS30 family transposase [Betaproteobacteria bacterium]|nr:IS30 family transposase [Betaproteobacteria bacterium]